jgi:hypothetical protein
VKAHRQEALAAIGDALAEVQGKRLPAQLIERSMAQVEPTWDPMEPVLQRLAEDARRLGYLPRGDLDRLVDRTMLDAALAARGRRP